MGRTQAEILAAVVAEGSYIRAAQQLKLTPSAVSHSISALEEEYGFPILVRNKYGVRLTSSGEHIFPYIQGVLNAEKALRMAVQEVMGLEQGLVKMAVFNSVCTNWVPEIIRSFQQLYPQVECEIFEGSYDDIIGWVRRGIVDFGFLSASSREDLPFRPLQKDPMLCVTPKGFTTRRKGKITAEEMREQPIVIQQKGVDADTRMVLDRYSLNLRTRAHVNDDLSMVRMVQSGYGISIMPALTVRGMSDEVDYFEITPPQYREIGLVCADEKQLSPLALRLMEHIEQLYKEN